MEACLYLVQLSRLLGIAGKETAAADLKGIEDQQAEAGANETDQGQRSADRGKRRAHHASERGILHGDRKFVLRDGLLNLTHRHIVDDSGMGPVGDDGVAVGVRGGTGGSADAGRGAGQKQGKQESDQHAFPIVGLKCSKASRF